MKITQERLKELLIYEPETGNFIRRVNRHKYKVGEIAGFMGYQDYVYIEIENKTYKAANLAWLYMTGEWPNEEIDHKDTDSNNDIWTNLREATRTENVQNRKGWNTLKLKGVIKRWYKFEARIRVDKKLIYLGLYNTAEEAHKVYKAKAAEIHKEFLHKNSK